MKLELRLADDVAAPGQELSGHVLVHEGGPSRALTLTLSFRERSPSFLATPFSEGRVIHEGDLGPGEAVEFRVEVPAWATPGVKGRHGELFWELEVVSDSPGLDARASRVVEVERRP